MRTGASPYSLDLDSQIQLLSRLQFLTRFSSHLIQVTGPQGAGKTWLSQRYLEQWAGVPQQALLLCHPQQTDAQHRRFLLQQLAPKAVFNEQDPIVDSMERIFAHFAVNMVIVVDEAHQLSPAVVAELWALVQQARVTPNWQISVLLFGHSGRLETYLDKITYGQEQRPLEVEIAPFTLEEAQAFVDACVGLPEQDASQRRALKARIIECAPWPGALMQLEQGEAQTMEAKGQRRPSPLLIVIALMAVVAVAIGWLFMPADNTASVSSVEETVTLPDTVGDRIGDADSSEGNTVADRQTAGRSQGNAEVKDDSASLPPEVHLEGLTVGRSDDNPRLVVPSDVVDAMLDEQSVGGSGEQSAVALTSETPPAEVIAPERQAPATERPEPKSAEADTVHAKPSAVSPADVTAAAKRAASLKTTPATERVELGHELRAVPASHYALQLAAMQSIAVARNFIDEYEIHDLAVAYETVRNDRLWYIIVTGNYPTSHAARQGIDALPANVQALKPWVKSYGQIHREMDRAK